MRDLKYRAVDLHLVMDPGVAEASSSSPLSLFGIYASVQFLRGRSVKLYSSLTLGTIDIFALIVMPPIVCEPKWCKSNKTHSNLTK